MNPSRAKPSAALVVSALCLLLTISALLPAAATAAPEGGESPQLAFEPGSYDFGLQQASSSSSQATLQLRNHGEAMAEVYSVDLVGPGVGAFWIGMNDCNGRHLNPGEACSVQVNFGPYDMVPFTAQLRASSEAGATFTADLSGEGGRAIFAPAVDPTNFGAVTVGSPGVARTIDVSNSGNMAGGIFIAVVSGGAIGSFHVLDENCTGIRLTPAAICNVEVSFQPLTAGAKMARLSLFGEGDGGTQITLTGIGVEPEGGAAAQTPGTSVAPAELGKQGNRARPRRHRPLRPRHFRFAVSGRRAIP